MVASVIGLYIPPSNNGENKSGNTVVSEAGDIDDVLIPAPFLIISCAVLIFVLPAVPLPVVPEIIPVSSFEDASDSFLNTGLNAPDLLPVNSIISEAFIFISPASPLLK